MSDSVLLRDYHLHERALLRFLARRLGSPVKASDLAHDLYVKLLGRVDDAPVRDSRALLFTMAANLATDHLRVERRRQELLSEASDLLGRRREELTPEHRALARAELDCLRAVIAGFPQRRRQVLYLSRFKGKTQAEIAALLGVGQTTVYKELSAAMAALLAARKDFHAQGPDEKDHRNARAQSSN